MRTVPFQVNDWGILAILPDGRVECLHTDAKSVIDGVNAGAVPPQTVRWEDYVLAEIDVEASNFHLKAPAIAFIEVTNHCNLKCGHCYAFSGPGLQREKEMPTSMIFELLDEYDRLGVLQVFLTGGEFFTHPDAVAIVKHAATKQFTTQIFTNGIFLKEKILAELPAGTSFFISFDTASPERTVRGGMDFPKLRARFEWMKKYGHAFRTAVSVHQKNYQDVEEIFQWCVDNDYPRPQWLETHPIGRALCNKGILLTPDKVPEVFGIFKRCMDRFATNPDDQDDGEDAQYFSIDTIKFCQRLEEATNQDKAGRSLVYVASNGNVYPNSNSMSNGDFLAGNLYDRSFVDVWDHGFDEFRRISFDRFKGCAACPVAKKGIWCQFRCPSLSKNITGDALTCGATDYLKEFMVLCDEYWADRERNNVRLRL